MELEDVVKEIESEMDAWCPTSWLEAKMKGLLRKLLEVLKEKDML